MIVISSHFQHLKKNKTKFKCYIFVHFGLPFLNAVSVCKQASSSCPHRFQTSVTAVVSLAILPRIVIFRRMVSITKFLDSKNQSK